MDKGEKHLILKIQNKNSRHSADELIRKYYREIYTYVYKQLGDKELSMDTTQEIFISMLKSIHTFDVEKSSFRTWLYSIATHKVIDFYRSADYRHIRSNLPIDSIDLKWDKDLNTNISNREIAEKILSYIKSRDVLMEEIFRLRFYGEYTFQEISDITKIPLSTVKTRYYKTVKELRKLFGRDI